MVSTGAVIGASIQEEYRASKSETGMGLEKPWHVEARSLALATVSEAARRETKEGNPAISANIGERALGWASTTPLLVRTPRESEIGDRAELVLKILLF